MLSNDKTEEQLKTNEKKIRELAIRLESLDKDTHSFLQELEVTPEQLTSFVSRKENFTEDNWESLQQQKKKLDEKLDIEIKNIRDPLKSKKALQSLNIAQHWLHVR